MRQTILRSGSCCNSDCENCLYCYAFEYYTLVACDLNGTAGGSTLGMHWTVTEGGSTTNKDTGCGTTGQRRRTCARVTV